jgi:hypothetical protein
MGLMCAILAILSPNSPALEFLRCQKKLPPTAASDWQLAAGREPKRQRTSDPGFEPPSPLSALRESFRYSLFAWHFLLFVFVLSQLPTAFCAKKQETG